LKLRPADRENLSARVEQELRRALMAGQFRPGDRLNIRDLAARLDTSATPVREALFRLIAERALEFRPGHSIRVPMPSRGRYLELRTIRLAVEGLAAREAAGQVTDKEIEHLARVYARYRKAKDGGHYEAALDFNQQFRFGVYQAARMPNLMSIIEGLWLQIGPFFNFLYPPLPTDPEYNQEYLDALEGLRRRDAAQVQQAIERAIMAGSGRLLAQLDRIEGAAAAP